jgi:DNA primase
MKRERAFELSERALTFLAERPADLQRFLTASGLSADEFLHKHTDETILAAVLGFVAADESLAKDFSTAEGLKPGILLNACAVIDPHGSSAW